MEKIKDIVFWIVLIAMGTYVLYIKGYILKNYQDISVTNAHNQMLVDTNITLLDVRTPQELKKEGKIENSLLIPIQALEQNIEKLERFKGTKIFVYCRSGNRSIAASRILANHGFHPYNIKGGINAWREAKLPLALKF